MKREAKIKISGTKTNGFLIISNLGATNLSLNVYNNIIKYNTETRIKTDNLLYYKFRNAIHRHQIEEAIMYLSNFYYLWRSGILKNHANAIASCLLKFNKENLFSRKAYSHNPEIALDLFNRVQAELTSELKRVRLFPQVTLSKLLHFYKPELFWIVDKKTLTLLRNFGYSPSYSGYREFLIDLYDQSNYSDFQDGLRDIDQKSCEGESCPILKIIDKILYSQS